MGRPAKPWYRKSTDSWYATIGGKQVKLATGANARQEASREFYRLKLAEDAAKKEVKGDDMPVRSLADMHLDWIESECGDRKRVHAMEYLPQFLDNVGRDTKVSAIKPHHLTDWVSAQSARWGQSTQFLATLTVKRMFSWGKESGRLAVDPVASVIAPKPLVREAFITNQQADRAIAECNNPALVEVMIALRETGGRPGEVVRLTCDCVDLDAGTWRVIDKNRNHTNSKYRTVYLSSRAIELSRELLGRNKEGRLFRTMTGKEWRNQRLVAAFWKLKNDLGYGEEFVAYAFRHLYITNALERGVNPATVAELVGHSDLTMIMRVYSKLRHRTNHLREAAQQVTGGVRSADTASRRSEAPAEPNGLA